MGRRGRRRRWKRNCRRMSDRLEHSDFGVVSPACRTLSSWFLVGSRYIWLCFKDWEHKREKDGGLKKG